MKSTDKKRKPEQEKQSSLGGDGKMKEDQKKKEDRTPGSKNPRNKTREEEMADITENGGTDMDEMHEEYTGEEQVKKGSTEKSKHPYNPDKTDPDKDNDPTTSKEKSSEGYE